MTMTDKINIACAEVVGYRKVNVFEWSEDGTTRLPLQYVKAEDLPDFATCHNAAMELVSWLWTHKDLACICENMLGIWSVTFQRYSGQEDQLLAFTAEHESLPLAICRAFLKANNIDPDKL